MKMEHELDLFPTTKCPVEKKPAGFQKSYEYAVRRTTVYLFPILNKLGYHGTWRILEGIAIPKSVQVLKTIADINNWFCNRDSRKGVGLLLEITNKDGKYILVQPWIRDGISSKLFNDYPRWHLDIETKKLPANERIPKMLEILRQHKIYFLIYTLGSQGNGRGLFWLQKYGDCTVSDFSLSYRNKSKVLDRMRRSATMRVHLQTISFFENQLITIFNEL